jgi:hypothetical protein
MQKNVAGQTVPAQLFNADGVGVTTGTTTVYVCGDNGTYGAGAGTVTHKGGGLWIYAPTAAETNYACVAYQFVNSAAISVTVVRETVNEISALIQVWLLSLIRSLARSDFSTDALIGGTFTSATHSLQALRAKVDALPTVAPDNARIATIDTNVGTIVTRTNSIETYCSGIKAKTDTLPSSPAAVGSQMTLTSGTVAAIQSGLATSTVANAIKAITDQIGTMLVLNGSTYRFTADAFALAPLQFTTGEVAQMRSALGLNSSGGAMAAPGGGVYATWYAATSTAAAQSTAAASSAATAAAQTITSGSWALLFSQTETAATKSTAIDAVTAKLDTLLVADGGVYQFTANALELGPSGAGSGTDWTAAEREQIRSALGINGTKTTAIGGQLQTINTVASQLGTMLVVDGAVYQFTANALELGPSGAGGTSDWTASEREQIRYAIGITGTKTATSGGEVQAIKAKTDNLPASPAAVGSAMTLTGATVAAIQAGLATATVLSDVKAKTDLLPAQPAAVGSQMDLVNAPNAYAIEAIHDGLTLETTIEAHVTSALSNYGTVTSSQLNARTLSAVNYATATTATAIKAKTDNLPTDPASNTVVNTRLAASSYTAPDNAGITAIKAKTDNLPASPAAVGSQMDLVNAPNATAIAAIQSGLATATTATAIKAKTDLLPTDPASNTVVNTRLASATYVPPDNANIVVAANQATSAATTAGTINTTTTAIKAKTDLLPSDPASNTQLNTRLASASYVAPDNAGITAIKAKTDNLPASPAAVGSAMTLTAGTITSIQSGLATSAVLAGVKTKTDNLPSDPASNTVVNTRLAAADYTAPDNANIAAAASSAATAATQATAAASSAATAATQATTAATKATAMDLVTTKLDTLLVADGVVYQFTANALENAPEVGSDVLDALGEITDRLDAISAKTALITGAGQVTVVSAVSLTGESLVLVWGDEYTVASENALVWEDAGDTWPTWIGSAVVTLTIRNAFTDELLTASTGTVITTGAHTQVRFPLTSTATRSLPLGLDACKFDLVAASLAGAERTLVRGLVEVLERQTRPT